MNKSGLAGNPAAVVLSTVCALFILPFSIGGWKNPDTDIRWKLVLGACIVSAVALMLFNGMIARAKPDNISILFVLVLASEMIAPVLYQIYLTGGLSSARSLGLLLIVIGGVLLIIYD